MVDWKILLFDPCVYRHQLHRNMRLFMIIAILVKTRVILDTR